MRRKRTISNILLAVVCIASAFGAVLPVCQADPLSNTEVIIGDMNMKRFDVWDFKAKTQTRNDWLQLGGDPRGMAWAPDLNSDGNADLFMAISDADNGHRVSAVNGSTGLAINASFATDQVNDPSDICVYGDHLYVANRGSGNVTRYDKFTGARDTGYVAAGAVGMPQFANDWDSIALSAGGILWVTGGPHGAGLHKFDANGNYVATYAAADLDTASSVRLSPDGFLYVTNYRTGTTDYGAIVRVNPADGMHTVLSRPYRELDGIAFVRNDSQDASVDYKYVNYSILVARTGNNTIEQYSVYGVHDGTSVFSVSVAGPYILNVPATPCPLKETEVLTCDRGSLHYDAWDWATGTLTRNKWIALGGQPVGMCWGPDINGDGINEFYLARPSTWGHYVVMINGATGDLISFHPEVSIYFGFCFDGVNDPIDLAVGGEYLYVANKGDGKVKRYNKYTGVRDSSYVADVGVVYGIAIDQDGCLWTGSSTTRGPGVHKYNTTGVYQATYATVDLEQCKCIRLCWDGYLWATSYQNYETAPTESAIAKIHPVTGAYTVVSRPWKEITGIAFPMDKEHFLINRYGSSFLESYLMSDASIVRTIVTEPNWLGEYILTPTPPAGTPAAPLANLDEVKKANNSSLVSITEALVSANFYTDGGEVYGFAIQNSDRSAGIRVLSKEFVQPGDIVEVIGGTDIDRGERIIKATVVNPAPSSPGTAPAPLATANKNSGGGGYGAQGAVVDDATQDPAKFAAGANNVGLLMTIYGKVTTSEMVLDDLGTPTYEGYFYVDDGSGIKDGSGFDGIRCRPAADANMFNFPGMLPAVGTYVRVTGVLGVIQINGVNVRYLWSTSWTPATSTP